MGYAQTTQHSQTPEADDHRRSAASQRQVPSDWFVDPVDPSGSQSALEEAATAFLAAHEAGLLTDSAPRLLSEGFAETVRPSGHDLASDRDLVSDDEFAPVADDAEEAAFKATLWDAVAPFADEEGGALAWQAQALCAQTDPEAFFPEKGGSTRDAKRVCAGCGVRQECLDYALENDERFGIWGGLSERERRRIRRSADFS